MDEVDAPKEEYCEECMLGVTLGLLRDLCKSEEGADPLECDQLLEAVIKGEMEVEVYVNTMDKRLTKETSRVTLKSVRELLFG